ncbi:YslB family protein [Secundilactobacillus folii]|nr:YslB family protein [Secundilactobacillus folii]
MDNQIYSHYLSNPELAPLFGKALFRDVVLNDLLGDDASSISYWEGKQLARRFSLGSIEDVVRFFQQAQLGDLMLQKQSAREWQFTLSGGPVTSRLAIQPDATFSLEAGFLAQTAQQMIGVVAETEMGETPKRANGISLVVHLDPKDPVSDPQELKPMPIINND